MSASVGSSGVPAPRINSAMSRSRSTSFLVEVDLVDRVCGGVQSGSSPVVDEVGIGGRLDALHMSSGGASKW